MEEEWSAMLRSRVAFQREIRNKKVTRMGKRRSSRDHESGEEIRSEAN